MFIAFIKFLEINFFMLKVNLINFSLNLNFINLKKKKKNKF